MLANRTNDFLRLLRMMSGEPAAEDAVLLARFAAERDEAAFAELVRRHGPLVLGVCQRVAGHAQDAEDAFQAVFLVLARKAGTLAQPERLPAFLYGVAYRIAKRARRSAGRRRNRELKAANRPEPISFPAADNADLWPALDREVTALPDWCRQAVILCDFDGVSRTDAARRLGIPGRDALEPAQHRAEETRRPIGRPRCDIERVAGDLAGVDCRGRAGIFARINTRRCSERSSGNKCGSPGLLRERTDALEIVDTLGCIGHRGHDGRHDLGDAIAARRRKQLRSWRPKWRRFPMRRGRCCRGKAVLADFKDYPGMPVHIEWAPSGSQFAITLMKNRGSDYSTAQLQVLSNHHLKLTWHLPEEKNLYSLGYSKDGTRLLYVKREQGLVQQPAVMERILSQGQY